MGILTNNWVEAVSIILVIAEFAVRLTPSEKDNSLFNKIKNLLDLILPNYAKGGKKH